MGQQQDNTPLIDKLLRTMDESKELLRRMHEAQKDLKTTIAEARNLHQEMMQGTRDVIAEIIEGHAAEIKPAFGRALEAALEKSNSDIAAMVNPLMETLQLLSDHYSKLLEKSESGQGMLASFEVPIDPKLVKSIQDAERRNKAR